MGNRNPRTENQTYLIRRIVVQNLLDLAITASGHLVKLYHGDAQINAHSTNNARGSHGTVQGKLGADYIDLLAHFDKDIVRSNANAVGVLVVERLAILVFAEEDMGIARRGNADPLNSTAVNQGEHLGRGGPRRRQSCKDDTSHLRG